MVKRIGSLIRKTKNISKKKPREKGKLSLTKYLAKFEEGAKVLLNWDSAVQGGKYHRRQHGKTGVVKGRQGRCYKVAVKEGKKLKTFIVHPIHLRKVEQ